MYFFCYHLVSYSIILHRMSDALYIGDFLQPVNRYMLSEDEGYKDGQIGKKIVVYEDEELPDLKSADIVLVGCNDCLLYTSPSPRD